MHDTLRRRILRKLDTLPESQLYQVLDYIEFLQSRYATQDAPDPSGLQRWAERLEDGLRKRTVKPGNLREAFQLISAADRVLNSVSEAGRQFLDELQIPEEEEGGRRPSSTPHPSETPPSTTVATLRGRPINTPSAGRSRRPPCVGDPWACVGDPLRCAGEGQGGGDGGPDRWEGGCPGWPGGAVPGLTPPPLGS
jgi:hypothetical protein